VEFYYFGVFVVAVVCRRVITTQNKYLSPSLLLFLEFRRLSSPVKFAFRAFRVCVRKFHARRIEAVQFVLIGSSHSINLIINTDP
jgi:hypothetical protein